MATKYKIVSIILCSIIVFLLLATLFPYPKLFLPFFVLSVGLVVIIPEFLERILDIMAIRRLRRLSLLSDEALQMLAVKEYRLLNVFIAFGALATLAVSITGFLMIEVFISDDSKEVFIGGVGILGIVLILIGSYFAIIFIRGLVLRIRKRKTIISQTARHFEQERMRTVRKR